MLPSLILALGVLSAHVEACLLPHERDSTLPGFLHRRQSTEEMEEYATDDYFALIRNNSIPVAANTTDRFNNGQIAPRGLGTRPLNATIATVMNVKEIKSSLQALVKEFGIEMFDLPEKTHDDAVMFGGKISDKTCGDTHRVFLTAGIHARERGGPDNLIYFISDLLWAKREGTGVTYGSRKHTNAQVHQALSVGTVFMPLLNPDGVVFDQATNLCWRKNRNPVAPVDLNRNFDFLWNYTYYFAPGVEAASTDPDSESFYGTGPFSEPESRNVKRVMDAHKDLGWYMDMHSFAGLVIYPWGDDENQSTDKEENFLNPAYDGKRGISNDTDGFEYKAYIDAGDWSDSVGTAERVAAGMIAGSGDTQKVEPLQAALLYPTSGSTADYAYSRTFADPSLGKIRGFGVEFGAANEAMGDVSCPFYPNQTLFNENIRSMGAGLMEFLLSAAAAETKSGGCDTPKVWVSAATTGQRAPSWIPMVISAVVFEALRLLL